MTDSRLDLETVQLLSQWHQGDRAALDRLLERDLPWIRAKVSKRLGELLRKRGETMDFVQEALLEVLRYAPRFSVASQEQFRALMARIVENVLRDQHDFFVARRRDMDREAPMPSDSVLQLDPRAQSVTRPSEAASRNEDEAWLRLALELLEPDEREVVVLRQWDGLSFAEVGERMGLTEDAARMRFRRALPKLSAKVEALRRGDV